MDKQLDGVPPKEGTEGPRRTGAPALPVRANGAPAAGDSHPASEGGGAKGQEPREYVQRGEKGLRAAFASVLDDLDARSGLAFVLVRLGWTTEQVGALLDTGPGEVALRMRRVAGLLRRVQDGSPPRPSGLHPAPLDDSALDRPARILSGVLPLRVMNVLKTAYDRRCRSTDAHPELCFLTPKSLAKGELTVRELGADVKRIGDGYRVVPGIGPRGLLYLRRALHKTLYAVLRAALVARSVPQGQRALDRKVHDAFAPEGKPNQAARFGEEREPPAHVHTGSAKRGSPAGTQRQRRPLNGLLLKEHYIEAQLRPVGGESLHDNQSVQD